MGRVYNLVEKLTQMLKNVFLCISQLSSMFLKTVFYILFKVVTCHDISVIAILRNIKPKSKLEMPQYGRLNFHNDWHFAIAPLIGFNTVVLGVRTSFVH